MHKHKEKNTEIIERPTLKSRLHFRLRCELATLAGEASSVLTLRICRGVDA